jgi:adenylate cyclase
MISELIDGPALTETTSAIARKRSERCLGAASTAISRLDQEQRDQPEEQAAILFIDIVGSARLSETLPPRKILRVLQRFHALMAMLVKANGGRVVNYTGDGLVATFDGGGSPPRGPADALYCALDMLHVLADWSAERGAQGKPPIAVGIGIHYGAIVLGLIGIRGHVQRGVFGDPVNVAKRLESMTRTIGSPLVVSDEVVAAVKGDPRADRRLTAELKRQGPIAVRGRCNPVSIWILDRTNAPPASGG